MSWCVLTKGQRPQKNDQKFGLQRDQAFSFLVCFFSVGQLLTRNLSRSLNLASGPIGWQLSGRKECRLHLTLSLLADSQTWMFSSGFRTVSHLAGRTYGKSSPPAGGCLLKALFENNPNQHICNKQTELCLMVSWRSLGKKNTNYTEQAGPQSV